MEILDRIQDNAIMDLPIMAGQPTPPPGHVPPSEIAGLMIRAYENHRFPFFNKALLNPYFWGGTLGGSWLTSHDPKGATMVPLRRVSIYHPGMGLRTAPRLEGAICVFYSRIIWYIGMYWSEKNVIILYYPWLYNFIILDVVKYIELFFDMICVRICIGTPAPLFAIAGQMPTMCHPTKWDRMHS